MVVEMGLVMVGVVNGPGPNGLMGLNGKIFSVAHILNWK